MGNFPFPFNVYVPRCHAYHWDVPLTLSWDEDVCRVSKNHESVHPLRLLALQDEVNGGNNYPLCHRFRSFDKVRSLLNRCRSIIESWLIAYAHLLR